MKAFFLKELLYNLLYIYFGGAKKPVLSRVCEIIHEKKIREVKPCNNPSEEKAYHTLLFMKSP